VNLIERAIHLGAVVMVLSLAACGGGGSSFVPASPTASPAPTAAPLAALRYVAFGDSTTRGVGSTLANGDDGECAPANTDSALPSPANCPSGMGFAPLFARQLTNGTPNSAFVDLGVPGATLDGTDENYANQSWGPYTSGVHADLLDTELAAVNLQNADVVTVYIGKNDVNVLYEAVTNAQANVYNAPDQPSRIQAAISDFGTRYQAAVKKIRSLMRPDARLIVFNLMNVGRQPGTVIDAQPTVDKTVLQALSVGITLNYINPLVAPGNTSGVYAVIDMLCAMPSNYDASEYSSDGVHPNDDGYAKLEAAVYSVVANGPQAPANSCLYTTGAPSGPSPISVRRATE
jgi:lysophospholipase L1-like esterase